MSAPVDLSPPRDWQIFEDFCWELFSAEWDDPEATKYGRPGEAQHGVDVVGQRGGRWHAVQCKRRGRFPERNLSEREVRDEVDAAMGQERTLDSLVIATTAPSSAKLSDLAARITEEVGFRVEVFGWEELVRRLQRHEDLFVRWRERLGASGLPHFSGVPLRNPHFQGRETLLVDLAHRLDRESAFVLTQAIAGLGGVGKTQTAIEYSHRYKDRYRYVIWADASSPEALIARYAELARLSGRVGPATPVDEAAQVFLGWLSSEDSWLLVLDNVEERPEELDRPGGHGGHLLITSRQRALPPTLAAGQPYKVDVLEPDDATAFLLKRVGREDASAEEHHAARELAEELGGLPLALEQAGAYIDDLELSFLEYLGELRRGRQVLALEEDSWGLTGGYEEDVASTWLLNMEAMPSAAREVMNCCAFLAPERIPLSLFVEHADLGGPALKELASELRTGPLSARRHLVRPLTRFSLFRFDPERQEVSVHRMVQWVARQRLGSEGGVRAMLRANSTLMAAFPEDPSSPSAWPACESLFPHALALCQNWSANPEATGVGPARLWSAAGLFAWSAGRSAEGLALERRVVEVRRQVLGEEHPDTLKSLNDLAVTLRTLGDAEGARELLEHVTELRRRVLGLEHPDTLKSLNNLAVTRWSLGDAEEALQLFDQVTELHHRVLGEEHPDTLNSLSNLAATRRALGDPEGARQLLDQVIQVRRRVLGEEHPDTLKSLNHLAAARRNLGDVDGARQIHEQVAEVRRRVLGEEHPDTLKSLNNLAVTLEALGDPEGARQLLDQVVEVSRRVLGEEHPDTLASLNNLAATCRALGDPEGARQLLDQVVEVSRRVLGEEHLQTLQSLNNLAITLKALGEADTARLLHEQVVQVRRRVLGEEHPATLKSLNNLAATLEALGDS